MFLEKPMPILLVSALKQRLQNQKHQLEDSISLA